MKRLDNQEMHERLISEMRSAFDGTAWEIKPCEFSVWNSFVIMISRTGETRNQQCRQEGPNAYAPDILIDEDCGQDKPWRIRISPNIPGPLYLSEIETFTAAIRQAEALARRLDGILEQYHKYLQEEAAQ